MTEPEVTALLTEWYATKGMHSSTKHICQGEAHDTLLAAGQEIVPILLTYLKTDTSFFIVLLLREITKEDIWAGENGPAGFRKVNVGETAAKWVEWGVKKGLIQA
jgi:hypothetical protein